MEDALISPQPVKPDSAFGGQISPADYALLLEFLNKNTPAAATARSTGSGTTTINDSSETQVTLNSNTFATGITWDATNHCFTCVTAGRYLVLGQVHYLTVTDAKVYYAKIAKNFTVVTSSLAHSGSTNPLSVRVSDILDLAVGDNVELYTEHNSGVSRTIANSSFTYLAIAKL